MATPKNKKRRLLSAARLRLMPLTMAMLSLLLVAKVNDVYWNSRQLAELLDVRTAQAADPEKKEEEAEHAEAPAEKEEAGHGSEGGHGESAAKPAPEPTTYGEGKLTLKEVEALKAKGTQQPYTQTELDLLQNLTQRREELDQRARDLELKSSVLEATEKRINDKLVEMKALEKELSAVVAEYKNQQDTEIKSLVKIYESMKPGDAAAIFNEMDMPILLEVIDRMSERKVAPVLAGMSPTRARDVTQELAELRKGRQRLNAASARTSAPN